MPPCSDFPGKSHDVTLAGMPDRVLLKIWLLLEEPHNFPSLCKSIRAFTQGVDIRAQYFVARYGTHLAMFRAIARPKIFDEALCQSLVQSGAVISLALMQELAKGYFAMHHFRPGASKYGWSATLSFPAVLAVLSEEAKAYPKLHLANKTEMQTFSDWFFGSTDVADGEVATIFLQRDFVPLPSYYFPVPNSEEWNSPIEKFLAVAEYTVCQRQARQRRRPHLSSSSGTFGDSQSSASLPLISSHSQADKIKAGTGTHRGRLDCLPDELLTRTLVLSHDPANLVRVSKRLYHLSQSCHMRAQYFLRRHGKGHAVFFAISRTKIFTEELFRTLLTLGATLPLALAQELVVRNFEASTRDYHCFTERGGYTAWGKHVAVQAILSVLAEAHKRYSGLHLNTRDLVEYYECASEADSWDTRTEIRAKFGPEYKTLFEEHNFVPLPFGLRNADDDDGEVHRQYLRDLRGAMIRWPKLASWLEEQDVYLPRGKDGILSTSLRNILRFQEGTSLRVQCFEQAHKSGHPGLTIDESLLTRVIMSLRWRKPANEHRYYTDRRSEPEIAYSIISELYSKGVFDLDFPSLWEKAILTLAQQESGVYAARIYRFVVHETDDTSTPFKLARWFAYFLLRQAHCAGFVKDLPLKSIRARNWTWANADRTADDVLGVLLLPAIVDDTSVLTYAKTHGLVKNWPQFLARAARCILLDPFKGKLLKAVNGWCKAAGLPHFPAILARAVENHAISIEFKSVMPGDEWRLTRHGEEHSLQHLPPRILTILSCNKRRQPSEELYMQGKGVQQGISLPFEDYTTFEKKNTIADLPTRFQGKAIRGHMNLGDLWTSPSNRPEPDGPDAFRAPFMEKLEHNALAVVKLCGKSSAAASVVMDHAVLSYQSGQTSNLLGLLIEAGCTFTLRHLYMLDRVARGFPPEFRDALLTLQVAPLASQEEEAALLGSLAMKHMEETHFHELEQNVAEALLKSPEGTVDLTFNYGQDGSIICTTRTQEATQSSTLVSEGRSSYWQPPPAGGDDLQSASTATGSVGGLMHRRISSESLIPKLKEDRGAEENGGSQSAYQEKLDTLRRHLLSTAQVSHRHVSALLHSERIKARVRNALVGGDTATLSSEYQQSLEEIARTLAAKLDALQKIVPSRLHGRGGSPPVEEEAEYNRQYEVLIDVAGQKLEVEAEDLTLLYVLEDLDCARAGEQKEQCGMTARRK